MVGETVCRSFGSVPSMVFLLSSTRLQCLLNGPSHDATDLGPSRDASVRACSLRSYSRDAVADHHGSSQYAMADRCGPSSEVAADHSGPTQDRLLIILSAC